jgi:hypothetical protein
MTKLETLLREYFGDYDRNLDEIIEKIATDNDSLNDMFQELKGILEWLNKEL